MFAARGVPAGEKAVKKFVGMSTREVQRLKELEKENARLKKLLAERDLDIDRLKEINAKNGEALPRRGRRGT